MTLVLKHMQISSLAGSLKTKNTYVFRVSLPIKMIHKISKIRIITMRNRI